MFMFRCSNLRLVSASQMRFHDLILPCQFLDPLHLDSLLSLQSCSRMGLLLPVCGVSGMGLFLSLLDAAHLDLSIFSEKRRFGWVQLCQSWTSCTWDLRLCYAASLGGQNKGWAKFCAMGHNEVLLDDFWMFLDHFSGRKTGFRTTLFQHFCEN